MGEGRVAEGGPSGSALAWRERLVHLPWPYAGGIAIALLLPRALGLGVALLVDGGKVTQVRLAIVVGWIALAGLTAYVALVEKNAVRDLFRGRPSLRLLGLAVLFAVLLRVTGPLSLLVVAYFWPRRPGGNWRSQLAWAGRFGLALVAGVALFALAAEVLGVGSSPQRGSSGRELLESLSVLDRLGLVVMASVTEEVRYRSYLMDRLHALRLSPGRAAVVSYLLFVAGHIPFLGLEYVLRVTAVGSVGFVVLYYLTRNWWACFFLHFVLNIFILAA